LGPMKKVCKQRQLAQRVAILLVNAEPAVVTTVENSYCLLKSVKKGRLAAVFHYIILRSVTVGGLKPKCCTSC
jgi:hypothetical protein